MEREITMEEKEPTAQANPIEQNELETQANPMEEKEPTAQEISVKSDIVAILNFAMQQNYVPGIRSLVVENRNQETINNLTFAISFEPQFARKIEIKIPCLNPREPVELAPVKMILSPEYFQGLTEKMAGCIHMELLSEAGDVFYQGDETVELLAYDEWTGLTIMPELICAFVTPNHPQIARIVGAAGGFLQKWEGSPSFTAYQRQNPNSVMRQMAAIYGALQLEMIAYHLPPASYEKAGQRVRMPQTVLQQKAGTCLDLALLYVSCLEAAGLNPILVFTEGHAFAGCWLEEETFSDCVIDDVAAIDKRIAEGIDQLCLVECTDFVAGKGIDFTQACKHGNDHLTNGEPFLMAVDVMRSRGGGIRPVPSKVEGNGTYQFVDYGTPKKSELTGAPKEISLERKVEEPLGTTVITKQRIWERKLLDFSLRNPLLNFRAAKSAVQLMAVNLDQIEDELSSGGEFQIMPKPTDWTNSLKDVRIYEIETQKDLIDSIASSEFKHKRICTFLEEAELLESMKNLNRQAKVSLEENGANTLYLALGFLRWYETELSEKVRYAPLILIPVDIVRHVTTKSYSIRIRDEETQLNITLFEMLRQDYGITIQGLDPLPEDEKGVDIFQIFNIIRQGIMPYKNWNIESFAFLSLFSFGQFIMWNDIRNRAQDLEKNKIVASLISGKMEWQPVSEKIEADKLDESITPSEVAIPTSVDSTQLAAICEAARGESFVLHGPPGTGKSQTITNMIANALYQGKSVLFVAEKMAALSVVQKRLADIGLDPFCLELHSNKAQKKMVLSQLEKTLSFGRVKKAQDYEQTAQEIHKLRKELNTVVEQVHQKRPCGWSLAEMIGAYEGIKHEAGKIKFSPEQVLGVTESTRREWQEEVHKLVLAGNETGGFYQHPLEVYGNRDFSQTMKNEFSEDMRAYLSEMDGMEQAYQALFPSSGRHPYASYLQLMQLLNDLEKLEQAKTSILEVFVPDILMVPYEKWKNQWFEAQGKWAIPRFFSTGNLQREMGAYAKGTKTVTRKNLLQWVETLEQYQKMDQAIGGSAGVYAPFAQQWKQEGNGALRACASGYQRAFGNFAKGEENFTKRYHANLTSLYEKETWQQEVYELFAKWELHKEELREWSMLLRQMDALETRRLQNVTDSYRRGMVKTGELETGFLAGFLQAEIAAIVDQEPVLSEFRGVQIEDTIEKYKTLMKQFQTLTIQELVAELSEKIPRDSSIQAGSAEIAILQKAIRSGGRMMPIRKLFDSIPNLLRRICPCMLMSPISVAQYIDPAFPKFDLVIFDEASQIPTCEAVGVIARGENVVVVGDPKQMPPTNFFKVNHVDDDNFDKEDLESVLDDCLALSMPQKHLLWHYRSRHESLIAYSNAQYYDHTLYTFPSPNDLVSKVRWVPMEGVYEKSGTRQNKKEAEAVVAEIEKRLENPQTRSESIGVVTFSVVQQNLIDDLLTEQFSKNPQLEELANAMYEPIFIKNLENVQGDERDVILFSVGYGPDKDGKVSMNFGPLNQDGGWRRLNVAITRARKEMMVFSTLRPEQIDLSRTRAEGVAGLKGFLEFAEKGKNTLAIRNQDTQVRDMTFETMICEKIHEMGYETKMNIGYSKYKVDIGVVDPNHPEEYALGIICDEGSYASSATARDRNVVQPGMLEGLGWQLYHLWTMDWYHNPQKELERIQTRITESIEMKKHEENEQPAEQPERKAVVLPVSFETEAVEELSLDNEAERYMEKRVSQQGTPEEFYELPARRKIMALLEKILETEAPISERRLFKKAWIAWGIARSGSKVEHILTECVKQMNVPVTYTGTQKFYWRRDQNPETYEIYRVSNTEQEKRSMEEICQEEISNAIHTVMKYVISIEEEDLVRETGRIFGFSRISNTISNSVQCGIQKSIERGFLTVSEDKKRYTLQEPPRE